MSHSNRKRKRLVVVFERDGGRCTYCCDECILYPSGSIGGMRQATVDHIIPASHGGTRALDNVVLACRECNESRGRMPFGVFVKFKRRLVAA
jgi:5-methylcytosine-specific restriction endonuclease McrA